MFSAEKPYICLPIFQSLKKTMTHVVVQFWCGFGAVFNLVNLPGLLNSSNLVDFNLLYFKKLILMKLLNYKGLLNLVV